MALTSLGGIFILFGSIIFLFLVVPAREIKSRLFFGLASGLGIALILIYLLQNIFGFWLFSQIDIIYIDKIPLFLSAAWTPAIIAFSYLMSKTKHTAAFLGLLTAYPLAATLVHYIMLITGTLAYRHWDLLDTFLIALGIHAGITAYLYATGQLENLRNFSKIS